MSVYYKTLSVVNKAYRRWAHNTQLLLQIRNPLTVPKLCQANIAEGSAAGGDDLILIVECVSKRNILVRFFEMDEHEQIVWETVLAVPDPDITQQYSIQCQTPAYQDRDIIEPVEVNIELVRPSDNRRSYPPLKFVYTPSMSTANCKRPCNYERKDCPEQNFCPSSSAGSDPAQFVEVYAHDSASSTSSYWGFGSVMAAQTSEKSPSVTKTPSRPTATSSTTVATYENSPKMTQSPQAAIYYETQPALAAMALSTEWSRLTKSEFPPLPLVEPLSSWSSFPALPKSHVRAQSSSLALAPLRKSSSFAEVAKLISIPLVTNAKPSKTSRARALHNERFKSAKGQQRAKSAPPAPQSRPSPSKPSRATPSTPQASRRRTNHSKYSMRCQEVTTSWQRIFDVYQRLFTGYYLPGHHAQVIKRILELWAEHISKSEHADSPLHQTVAQGEVEAGNMLCQIIYHLQLNALIDRSVNIYGRNALHLACLLGRSEFIYPMMIAGANLNRQDQCGNTALHIAARRCHIDCIQQLLMAGDLVRPSFTLRNERGHTPMHVAIRRNYHGAAHLLLRAEPYLACIGVSATSGSNALHLALLQRNRQIIALILTSPNVQHLLQQCNVFGQSAFDLANQYELSDMLVHFTPVKQEAERCKSTLTSSCYSSSDEDDNITVIDNPLYCAQKRPSGDGELYS